MDAVRPYASGDASTYQDVFTGSTLAYSIFQIRFEITEATAYTLSGAISRQESLGYTGADVVGRLSSGGVDLYYLALPNDTLPLALPVAASGELAPGEYELYAAATSSWASGDQSRGSFEVLLAVPESAGAGLLAAGLLALAGRALRAGRQPARSSR